MKSCNNFRTKLIILFSFLFSVAIGYYIYSLSGQKNIECFAAKNGEKQPAIVSMDYLPTHINTSEKETIKSELSKDKNAVIEKNGIRIALRLKSAKLDADRAGLLLTLNLKNNTANELEFNLLDLKVGIMHDIVETTYYPEINENSFIKVKPNSSYQKQLVYYPENDIQENRIHLYNGDFLKEYFINVGDFLVKDGQPLLQGKITFAADEKVYQIYKKRYARNGKYIDYHYVPDRKQQDAFAKERIMSTEDLNGYNLLRNQTSASISIFAYKNQLNLRLKIINGDIAMDARKIRLITPDGKKLVSENGFKDFVGKTPYAPDKNTYILLGPSRIEHVFRYNVSKIPKKLVLDLSGLIYRYHDESHEVEGAEEKSDQGPFLPATVKFEFSTIKK